MSERSKERTGFAHPINVDFPVRGEDFNLDFLADCDLSNTKRMNTLIQIRAEFRKIVAKYAGGLGMTPKEAECGCKDRVDARSKPSLNLR